MLSLSVIGNVGSNAELRNENGNEFVTFKVAHNDRWTDSQGVVHDKTLWVSCVMNGNQSKLAQYLVKGTQVFVMGDAEVRTYHSQQARAMVAGINLRVRQIQLIGGKPDAVPSVLFDKNGREVRVSKLFYAPDAKENHVFSRSGDEYVVDSCGWVYAANAPYQNINADENQDQESSSEMDNQIQDTSSETDNQIQDNSGEMDNQNQRASDKSNKKK